MNKWDGAISRLENILEIWETLGETEKKVLITFAFRLLAGQRKYGKLDLQTDKRAWTWEAAEEALDMSCYLAAELIHATEESRRKYFDGLKDEDGVASGTE